MIGFWDIVENKLPVLRQEVDEILAEGEGA